ncbi:hypothetical protein SO802_014832 [Lithocarpus litseifolius]|uniref:RNase H type-1 domain-containing protein n=1 Tax=Lithocarpus litseifolius TaxID=425828 RepID=A0AAW2CVL7_9ROSI
MATTSTLSFASDIGIQRAILEGDSLAVFKALEDDVDFLAPFGLLIKDVKVLSQQFDQMFYSHTKRKGNSIAHGLGCQMDGFEVDIIGLGI